MNFDEQVFDWNQIKGLGNTGLQVSRLGCGLACGDFSDIAHEVSRQSDLLGDRDPPGEGDDRVEPEDLLKAIWRSGVGVFDLGCIARSQAPAELRLQSLQSALGTVATRLNQAAGPVAIVRLTLSQMVPNRVRLPHLLAGRTVGQLLEMIEQCVQRWAEIWAAANLASTRSIVVLDDLTFRPEELSRSQLSQVHQLVGGIFELRSAERLGILGVGGFYWQGLAELVSRHAFDFVLTRASSGMLGPDLQDSLIPICQFKGIGIMGSFPLYGGLLGDCPLQLEQHPANQDQRLNANAANLVASEYQTTVKRLAWASALLTPGIDCTLIEIPTADYLAQIMSSTEPTLTARSEAMILRHLRSLDPRNWQY